MVVCTGSVKGIPQAASAGCVQQLHPKASVSTTLLTVSLSVSLYQSVLCDTHDNKIDIHRSILDLYYNLTVSELHYQ